MYAQESTIFVRLIAKERLHPLLNHQSYMLRSFARRWQFAAAESSSRAWRHDSARSHPREPWCRLPLITRRLAISPVVRDRLRAVVHALHAKLDDGALL